MSNTVIVTGVNGQDGSYLSELLLKEKYNVVGLVRRQSTPRYNNLEEAGVLNNPGFSVEVCDITDPSSVFACVQKYQPFAIFNLAAQSHVKVSFEQPLHTFDVDTVGVLNILEAVRQFSPHTRIYQASTSEMFGSNFSSNDDRSFCYQDELTQFYPESPYAIAKIAAHQMCELYRKAYKMHVSCGILFNHESPRRGLDFVTRKVTNYVGMLVNGKTDKELVLGNLEAYRDWGFAGDYMEAALAMVNSRDSDTYVVATGKTHSIRDLCKVAFEAAGISEWYKYVTTSDVYKRPSEVPFLLGQSSKIKRELKWEPKVSFNELIKLMVDNDIRRHSNVK
jgi:GDPmannose 4,6-dehydratase